MPSIMSGFDYLALPRDPETWIVENLLPTGGSMLLYGDPKVGKSYAALQLAAAISAGVDWLDFKVPQPTPVVYIQLDTPRSLWAKRVDELTESHAVEALYYADRESLNAYPFDILNPEHFATLTTALRTITATSDEGHPVHIDPGVVIIDTLREAHSGDENDSTAMQEVIAHLDAAVKPAALILISHARKSSADSGHDLMNDNRGSNYLVGRMDSIVRFSKTSMRATSRTMEEHTVKLDRQGDGTWEVAVDPWTRLAEQLLRQHPDKGDRELARVIHDLDPSRSESAAKSWFHRHRPAK